MRKPSRQRAQRQSVSDAKKRKRAVRLKASLKLAYGGSRRHDLFVPRGHSLMQAAASSLSIGALIARHPGLLGPEFNPETGRYE